MRHLLSLVTIISTWPMLAVAEAPAEAQKAAMLVQQLGDPRFRIREAAARELIKLGRKAKPALLEGSQSADAEIATRCERLLPDVLAADLKARVDRFVADVQGMQNHDLPMLARYQRIAGNELAARKLFAEILVNHGMMLEECEFRPSSVAATKYIGLAFDIQSTIDRERTATAGKIKIADLAAMLLVGADPKLTAEGDNKNAVTGNLRGFLYNQEFQRFLVNGELSAPFRKLFFAWADERNDLNSVNQVLTLIQNIAFSGNNSADALDMRKLSLEYAIKTMKLKDLQIMYRAQAMVFVGRVGGKDHVAILESFFQDKTQLSNLPFKNLYISTQLADVALAMAIHLSGQEPREYGFDVLQTNPNMIWSYHFLGFSGEEKRSAAFKKYAEQHEAAQKK